MRAPWICSFFFAFFLIFSSNTEFHSWAQKTNPLVVLTPYFRIPPPLMPVSGPVIYVRYPPNTLQPLPTANLSTTWTNDESFIPSINFTDGSKIRVILDEEKFACGFFCNGNCTSYLFAVVIKISYSPGYIFGTKGTPTVIWSANRDNPVREGAILNLSAAGELILHDVDGSIVWTTNTAGKSTAGMNLTDNGNLMLFDGHKSMVWQSFDYPTDCLVAGQKLFQGQKLIPSVSSTNWTTQKDSYYLQLTDKGLFAYVQSNPPQVYYKRLINVTNTNKERIYVELLNGSLCFFNSSTKLDSIDIPQDISVEFTKLMPDGHLKAFGGETVADLLTEYDFGDCSYPLACGRNAICSADIQCSCPKSISPGTEYFRAVDDSQPNKGCSRVTPLTCNDTKDDQSFIEIQNIKYFTYIANMEHVDMETCKQACLNNCSCKAAIFEYLGSNSSSGYCDLPSELFTMTNFNVDVHKQVHASAFIKVQNGRYKSPKRKNHVTIVLGSTVGSLVLLVIVVVVFTKFIGRKEEVDGEMEEEYLDKVPGMPTRFSYEELKTATENFSKKLGEGGFGSVFEGALEVDSKIAVKCLHGLGLAQVDWNEVRKSFLAEVESIGSIHHVNLVQLRGFCAWKSERLLVYEFMSNGSLDGWIYNGDRKHVLKWECRKKIILDIAKGLAYLHEECRQKIIHLDIKLQNILLDSDFNAKVSDFGLSKLMDRNQSRQVMSTVRGTFGYMAPECFNSIITEKADVYSFGIVLLEILCGRKNLDISQPKESQHLLGIFQRCWEQGTLLHIVDRYSKDMQEHGTEVVEMMKVVSWCLQIDYTKRPSMSSVVKVIEGVMDVETNLDYHFLWTISMHKITDEYEKISKPMSASILSGPR